MKKVNAWGMVREVCEASSHCRAPGMAMKGLNPSEYVKLLDGRNVKNIKVNEGWSPINSTSLTFSMG